MATSKSTSPASAKPDLSATELELKRRGRRRLIGAFTLGLLAIVFLPMLFDSAPKKDQANSREIAIQVPPKEGLSPLPAPTPSTAPPAVAITPTPAPPSAPLTAPTASPASAPPSASTAIAKPETKGEPKSAALAATPATGAKSATLPPIAAPIKAPPLLKQGFVVQIGAFKDAANAQQIVASMKEAKLPVFTDSIATSGGSVIRVRVGPFASKEKADSALAQVKLAGADGKIVPLK